VAAAAAAAEVARNQTAADRTSGPQVGPQRPATGRAARTSAARAGKLAKQTGGRAKGAELTLLLLPHLAPRPLPPALDVIH